VVLGRLTDQKRVELAIEALALLRDRGQVLPMRVVGDGEARRRLEQLASTRRLDAQVQFLGAVAPSTIPGILSTADVVVMPALKEGMGLAAAEALIQGVPVVACRDGGGLLDVVPTSSGGRLVGAEPASIADAVASVLGDPESRDAAWLAGRAWNHRLNPEHVAEQCLAWYERVLAA
jgi:glycosyltransferase involved in cell wall biosynthesis